MAFLSAIPLSSVPRHQSTIHRRPQITAKASKPTRAQPPNPSPIQSTPSTPPLTTRLTTALSGLNRGLAIDADAELLTPEEALVEDLITELEALNPTPEPTASPALPGVWTLVYTSSSITRFFGGVTGLQRLLPGGRVGRIDQIIDPEDGTSQFVEVVQCELPFVGPVEWVATADGALRKTSMVRLLWEPEKVRVGWFDWFADGWKTLRAFQICDTTYLDDTLRITRGTTGSVHVYQRSG